MLKIIGMRLRYVSGDFADLQMHSTLKSGLILNIKNGFEIIETDLTDKDGMKILMEMKLNGN